MLLLHLEMFCGLHNCPYKYTFDVHILYTEGFFWAIYAWLCMDGPPCPFRLELSYFFLVYKLHRQASLGTTSFKFLYSVLLIALACAWKKDAKSVKKRLSIANKIMRFWVLVLRNPYCPLQSQKMFLVEASTNFSFAIIAKVNLDRIEAKITQRLFSHMR